MHWMDDLTFATGRIPGLVESDARPVVSAATEDVAAIATVLHVVERSALNAGRWDGCRDHSAVRSEPRSGRDHCVVTHS